MKKMLLLGTVVATTSLSGLMDLTLTPQSYIPEVSIEQFNLGESLEKNDEIRTEEKNHVEDDKAEVSQVIPPIFISIEKTDLLTPCPLCYDGYYSHSGNVIEEFEDFYNDFE